MYYVIFLIVKGYYVANCVQRQQFGNTNAKA
jgi:hypothetical protein